MNDEIVYINETTGLTLNTGNIEPIHGIQSLVEQSKLGIEKLNRFNDLINSHICLLNDGLNLFVRELQESKQVQHFIKLGNLFQLIEQKLGSRDAFDEWIRDIMSEPSDIGGWDVFFKKTQELLILEQSPITVSVDELSQLENFILHMIPSLLSNDYINSLIEDFGVEIFIFILHALLLYALKG